MDLSGTWRATKSSEDLRRAFPGRDLDDSHWSELSVPGHWRSAEEFATHDGPLLYRRRFQHPPPTDDRRAWLVLDGIFYYGDVWLDGSYLGDTEGYFFPHAFDVSDGLRDGQEHVLAVEVGCPRPTDRTAKRAITGVFQHWDCLDPDWNPGGIWRPVRIEESGPVRIIALRTVCSEATEESATVTFCADLDARSAGALRMRSTVGGVDQEFSQTLAAGRNEVAWSMTVEHPQLWWPWSLGAQKLHEVAVEVVLEDGTVSDRRRLRIGLRQIRMRDWRFEINGERMFLKGSNQGPTRMALGEATPHELARDVSLARQAGLDLLRVHAHITRPELYDAADDVGLLLWQDFPLQWGYSRAIRKQAARQARAAVDLLGHHPSIAVWCGHNEPIAIDVEPGLERPPARTVVRMLVGAELPTWNKTVLDHTVRRALERADTSRPVIAHSGIPPHPGSGGTDSHLYFGWYHGDERDLPGFLAAWPRMGRFLSEFGAQAVPTSDEFMDAGRWPDLDWAHLARTHCLQRWVFDRRVPPAEHATYEAWRDASQRYQAELIKHHIEALRVLKYRPTGGFCQFSLADAHPMVSWAVLDHLRVPKLGYTALRDACQPVIVVCSRPAERYRPGDSLALDVHVVSDLREPLQDARVDARLGWTGGEHSWSWQGDVGADDCVRVGTVQAVVPDAPGPLHLRVALAHPESSPTNSYTSVIGR